MPTIFLMDRNAVTFKLCLCRIVIFLRMDECSLTLLEFRLLTFKLSECKTKILKNGHFLVNENVRAITMYIYCYCNLKRRKEILTENSSICFSFGRFKPLISNACARLIQFNDPTHFNFSTKLNFSFICQHLEYT